MPEKKINSTYVRGLIEKANEKKAIAQHLFDESPSLCERPMREVWAIINAKIEKAGFKHPLNEHSIRAMRYAERVKHGLPLDGLILPEVGTVKQSVAIRRGVAFAIARERKGDITGDELREEVRRRMHSPVSLSAGACVEVARKVRREVARAARNGSMPAPLALVPPAPPAPPLAPEAAPVAPHYHVPADSVSKDCWAAIELLVPTLRADGIITITITCNPDGTAAFTAERRAVQSVAGAFKV